MQKLSLSINLAPEINLKVLYFKIMIVYLLLPMTSDDVAQTLRQENLYQSSDIQCTNVCCIIKIKSEHLAINRAYVVREKTGKTKFFHNWQK